MNVPEKSLRAGFSCVCVCVGGGGGGFAVSVLV